MAEHCLLLDYGQRGEIANLLVQPPGNFPRLITVKMEPSSAYPNDIPRPLLRPLLPSTAPRGEAPSLPPKRHRVSLACAACRARKTKVMDESQQLNMYIHAYQENSATDDAPYVTSV